MTTNPLSTTARRAIRVATALICALVASLACVSSAGAQEFGLTSFDTELSSDQAGAHADLDLSFQVQLPPRPNLPGFSDELSGMRAIVTDLPPGLVGEAGRFTPCPRDAFLQKACDSEAQVGAATTFLRFGQFVIPISSPVHLIETSPTVPVQIGFSVLPVVPAILDASVRTGSDYGLTTSVFGVGRAGVEGVSMTLWGHPASHGTNGPDAPFMTNPTACGGPLESRIKVTSWDDPDTWHSLTATAPAMTGCEKVSFFPSMEAQPTNAAAGAPTGLTVDVSLPDSGDPNAIAGSALRDAEVTLPEGMALSPSAAHGLTGCTDEQFKVDSPDASACPLSSKVGKVTIDSPALRLPVAGSIFVGSQQPFDPYRVFVLAEGQGVRIKLRGSIEADPVTGQLTATFDENPQLPFTNLRMEFFGGPRAALVNPESCGSKTVTAVFDSWSGKSVQRSDTFHVSGDGQGGACAAPRFSPSAAAGVTDPSAGESGSFVLRIAREDADDELGTITARLPEGLLAKTAGVPLCDDAPAAAGTCPDESQVGRVQVTAGAGSTPFPIDTGKAFLTGPYKGAPYGLSIAVPAKAGPYDLGTVVVRTALHVDPDTAAVTAVSDPLPTILEGIPIELRSLDVIVDRSAFMVNPTDCDPTQVGIDLTSVDGATAQLADRFRIGDCALLGFAPKLALRLTGRGQRHTGDHPGLRAVLRQPKGQANLSKVKVKLPRSLALDPGNANGLCSYEDGLEASCPASSRIGRAVAHTPLLDEPLSGPVYFVQGVRFDKQTGARIRTLPTLLVKLRGEIDINLRARSTVSGGRLVSTFGAIPDAPVSKFTLTLRGGEGGILAVTGEGTDICDRRQAASVETDAQSGKRRDFAARIGTPCPRRKR